MGLSPEYIREGIVVKRYDVINIYRRVKDAMNNYDMEKCHQLLQQLEEMVSMDISINRQELKHMDCLYRFKKREIASDECVNELKNALQYTVPLESILNAKDESDIYLTHAELGCLYSIFMKSRESAKGFDMDLLLRVTRQCIPENSINISMYELIMNGMASRLGDVGEYERSMRISESVMRVSLSARRMGMLQHCLYNRLWNRMEAAKKGLSEVPDVSDVSTTQELQKCIQLAKLCKQNFYEKFYSGKLCS